MKNPTPPTGVTTFNKARTIGRFNAAQELKRTRKALVKSGHAWATQERLAECWDVEPQRFAQFEVDGGNGAALVCGDVEALGARFAIPFYQRCIARLQAEVEPAPRDLRDLAEMATERCAAFTAAVREARRDGEIDLRELDLLDAELAASEAQTAASRAELARLRAVLSGGAR